jgi:hypothetical protein
MTVTVSQLRRGMEGLGAIKARECQSYAKLELAWKTMQGLMKRDEDETEEDADSAYLAYMPNSTQLLSQLINDQILNELNFYAKYLQSISVLVQKRQSLLDSYLKVAATRPA